MGWQTTVDGVGKFHASLADAGTTPMDEIVQVTGGRDLPSRLLKGLQTAASLGLVEIWEAGLPSWELLDAIMTIRERGPLPLRIRILASSGIAREGMRDRIGDPWIDIVGVKFYADGWLGTHTCALHRPFSDDGSNVGILFRSAEELAAEMAPYAQRGWLLATHAMGDRAIEAVLDAYEMIWESPSEIQLAQPRIEHVSVLSSDLVHRMAELGVVACIQPSFARTDAKYVRPHLGTDRAEWAFAWQAISAAGVPIISGSDYPIETLDPVVGLQRLVDGYSERASDPKSTAAPINSRLPVSVAIAAMTSEAAGYTALNHDPITTPGGLQTVTAIATRPQGAP